MSESPAVAAASSATGVHDFVLEPGDAGNGPFAEREDRVLVVVAERHDALGCLLDDAFAERVLHRDGELRRGAGAAAGALR